MNLSYLLLSRFLQYPSHDLQQFCEQQASEVLSEIRCQEQQRVFRQFIDYVLETPLAAQQQTYVATFDFHKRASLYMSFHSFGDRRERGMAMVNLKQRFRAAGFQLHAEELPDYLPVVLEFSAFAESDFAREVLGEFRLAIELIRATLREEESPYQALFDALLLTQPPLTDEQREQMQIRAAQGPPAESVGLDPFIRSETHPVGVSS